MHFSIYKTIPLLVIVLAHGNAHKNKIVDLSGEFKTKKKCIFPIGKFRFVFAEIPELQYLNKSVDPCENFYEFTCGNFKNVHQKPEEELIWDHFTILQKEIHALLKRTSIFILLVTIHCQKQKTIMFCFNIEISFVLRANFATTTRFCCLFKSIAFILRAKIPSNARFVKRFIFFFFYQLFREKYPQTKRFLYCFSVKIRLNNMF